jgi:hypothetical protein
VVVSGMALLLDEFAKLSGALPSSYRDLRMDAGCPQIDSPDGACQGAGAAPR